MPIMLSPEQVLDGICSWGILSSRVYPHSEPLKIPKIRYEGRRSVKNMACTPPPPPPIGADLSRFDVLAFHPTVRQRDPSSLKQKRLRQSPCNKRRASMKRPEFRAPEVGHAWIPILIHIITKDLKSWKLRAAWVLFEGQGAGPDKACPQVGPLRSSSLDSFSVLSAKAELDEELVEASGAGWQSVRAVPYTLTDDNSFGTACVHKPEEHQFVKHTCHCRSCRTSEPLCRVEQMPLSSGRMLAAT